MSAGSPDDIETALRNGYLAAVTDAETLTAFENVSFDSKDKDIWYQFHYLPNRPEVATLGSGGQDIVTGIVQIDVNIKLGSGKTGLKTVETALRSAFTAGARFTYASASVTINSCGRTGGGMKIRNHLRFPISISFESRISRN